MDKPVDREARAEKSIGQTRVNDQEDTYSEPSTAQVHLGRMTGEHRQDEGTGLSSDLVTPPDSTPMFRTSVSHPLSL